MLQLIIITSLIAANALLCIPMTRKPLAEDDGYWFYLATFFKSGVRQFKNYKLHGYWGIPWLASLFLRAFRPSRDNWPYYFKILWYTANTLSIYGLSYCLWRDPLQACLAGLLFAACLALPNTLFLLTYAEHFYILPVNASITCAYLGVTQSSLPLCFTAGLLMAWAFQMKSTCLLYCIALPLIFLNGNAPASMSASYALALAALTISPLLIVSRYAGGAKGYGDEMFGSITIYLGFLANRLGLRRRQPAQDHELEPAMKMRMQYLRTHHNKAIRQQWRDIRSNLQPAFNDLLPLVILAVPQLAQIEPQTLIITALMVLAVMVYLAQKNYYTPHMNPIWVPVCILAAKTVIEAYALAQTKPVLLLGLTLALVTSLIRPAKAIVQSFRQDQATQFGFLWSGVGLLFQLAATIGTNIANTKKPGDRLLVWGDHPSLFVYANTPAWRQEHMFIYALQPKPPALANILKEFRIDPPELVQFYNWNYKDEWNMEFLSDRTGIPYRFIKDFAVADEQGRIITTGGGITLRFPLYRRDDDAYCEILLDRAVLALENDNPNEAHGLLNQILNIKSYHYEAALRLELMELDHIERKELLAERSTNESSSRKKAVQQRLLADLALQAGDTAEALRLYQQVIEIKRGDFRSYIRLGEIHFMEGNFEAAYQAFRQSIEIHPYSADAFNNLGVLKIQTDNPHEARELFERALRLNPAHPDARANLESLAENNTPAPAGENPCAE